MRREQKDLSAFRAMLERVRKLHSLEIVPARAASFDFERDLFGRTCDIPFMTGAFFEEIHLALYRV